MKQVKECEGICKDIVDKKLGVFAAESGLAAAKDIQGLRAIFDEVSVHCVFSTTIFFHHNCSIQLYSSLAVLNCFLLNLGVS